MSDTDISGRLSRLKILGSLYWGCGGNPGGEDGVADGLADGGAGVIADGLAEADGVAFEGDLDVGEALDDVGDEDDLEEVGVDGELSSSSEHSEWEAFLRRELSLTPATHSQSTVLCRSRTTLAFRWKDPDASPP